MNKIKLICFGVRVETSDGAGRSYEHRNKIPGVQHKSANNGDSSNVVYVILLIENVSGCHWVMQSTHYFRSSCLKDKCISQQCTCSMEVPPFWWLCFTFQPYLSSTRSLSPMSGLFGSIWAPQNDVFDGYCPVSGSPPHSEHVGTHSMLCKQEYSSRFNPFHAYMNLDIWTTANRNQSFPVSRDSGYCGNMWTGHQWKKMWLVLLAVLVTRMSKVLE